jgi:hypothetical protein
MNVTQSSILPNTTTTTTTTSTPLKWSRICTDFCNVWLKVNQQRYCLSDILKSNTSMHEWLLNCFFIEIVKTVKWHDVKSFWSQHQDKSK